MCLDESVHVSLEMSLTRFEFLSRVADGALPSSFSKECCEDILAFKSRVLSALGSSRSGDQRSSGVLTFRLLSLDDNGRPVDETLEVPDV